MEQPVCLMTLEWTLEALNKKTNVNLTEPETINRLQDIFVCTTKNKLNHNSQQNVHIAIKCSYILLV